jgi:hypothetical protein
VDPQAEAQSQFPNDSVFKSSGGKASAAAVKNERIKKAVPGKDGFEWGF